MDSCKSKLLPTAYTNVETQRSYTVGIDSTTTPSSCSQKSVSTGAIVGGVLGAFAFGVLVTILTLFILRRRRARKQIYAYQDAALRDGVNDPNILSVSNFPDFLLFYFIHLCFTGPHMPNSS
jgi:hypothetical protein